MNDTTLGYVNLEKADSWVNYLRTRLPYSFMAINEQREQGEAPPVFLDTN